MDTSTPIAKPPNCSTVAEEVGDELVLTRPRGSRFFGVVLLLILVSSTYLFVAIPLDAMGIAALLPGILRPGGRFHRRPPGKPIDLRRLPVTEWLVVIPVVVGWPFLIAWTVGHLSGFDQVRIGPGGIERLRGTLLRRRRRSVPLNEVRGLVFLRHFVDPPLILTWGPPIPLGRDWADRDEREWLTDLVRRKLLDLKARDRSSPTPRLPPTVAVSLAPPRVTFSTLHEEEAETDRVGRISGFGGCLVPTLILNGMVAGTVLESLTPFAWNRHGLLLFSLVPGLFLVFLSIGAGLQEFWLGDLEFRWR